MFRPEFCLNILSIIIPVFLWYEAILNTKICKSPTLTLSNKNMLAFFVF